MENITRSVGIHDRDRKYRIPVYFPIIKESSPASLSDNKDLRMKFSIQLPCRRFRVLSPCKLQRKFLRRYQKIHIRQQPFHPRVVPARIHADLYPGLSGHNRAA